MPDKYTVWIVDTKVGIPNDKKNLSWVDRTILRLYSIVENGWNALIIMYYTHKLRKW